MNILQHGLELSPEERIQEAVSRRFGEAFVPPRGVPHIDAFARINERSVCRSYRTDPVEESVITLLCMTALSSPSKSDLQQADIIRVREKGIRAHIDAMLPNSPWIRSAPEFFIICGNNRRQRKIFEQRKQPFPNGHLDAFFNAAVDAGIVLSTFLQAAHLAGLGSCPISEIRDHIESISELLDLPEYVFPVAGLTLGHPLQYEPLSPRLGLNATIHTDRFQKENFETEVAKYDRRRIRERPYPHQRDTERFGEAVEYGWSEDKFRQYSYVQREGFGTYIRKQGFSLD